MQYALDRAPLTPLARQNYFGFKTLERSYLLRIDGKVAERPQHMLMRVAVGIHGSDIERVLQSYNLMSERYFTHASPTLFNAGTPHPQLSSCFLVTMKDDSIEGIYDTLKTCALISKTAGGIGLSIHNIRATGSYIAGTNGYSNGIIPMLRVYNNTARYVDQGGNKRPGAFAIYLEPWHADIFEFLDLRKNHGKEEVRARDLFFALWIPDLFMERVEQAGDWPLFCPAEAPGLHEVYGDEFKALFTQYEKEGRAKKTIPAQKLWYAILEAQVETGNPFMLYKDAANSSSFSGFLVCLSLTSLTVYREVQPEQPRYDQVFEPLHGDHRVLGPRRVVSLCRPLTRAELWLTRCLTQRCLQPRFDRPSHLHQGWSVRLQEASRGRQGASPARALSRPSLATNLLSPIAGRRLQPQPHH